MASRRNGPFRAFRIADNRHKLFDGAGAFLHGGRWTSAGCRVIHAAETYAGALLETLVRSNLGRAIGRDAWIAITVPASVEIEDLPASEIPEWSHPNRVSSREYGNRWFEEQRTAVLVVPSLVTQGIERNVLINQQHPLFSKIGASEPSPVHWDERLFQA